MADEEVDPQAILDDFTTLSTAPPNGVCLELLVRL